MNQKVFSPTKYRLSIIAAWLSTLPPFCLGRVVVVLRCGPCSLSFRCVSSVLFEIWDWKVSWEPRKRYLDDEELQRRIGWKRKQKKKEGKSFQFAPQELLRSRYLSTSIMLSVNKLDSRWGISLISDSSSGFVCSLVDCTHTHTQKSEAFSAREKSFPLIFHGVAKRENSSTSSSSSSSFRRTR